MKHGSLSFLPYAKQPPDPFLTTLQGDISHWVNALNNEYSVIQYGKRTLYYNKIHHTFVRVDDIKIAHGRKWEMNGVRKNVVDLWLNTETWRPHYDSIVFNPSYDYETSLAEYNQWTGWNHAMTHQHVSYSDYVDYVEPFLYVLETWACSGNSRDMKTLQAFLAHLIQKPHEKPQHAIVLQNDVQGVRSVLMGFLEALVGSAWIYRAHDTTHLSTHLLESVRHTMVLYAYDVSWRDKAAAERILCDVIQSPELNYKTGIEKNYTRCVLASYQEHHLNLSRHGDELFIPTVNRAILPFEIKEQVAQVLQSPRGMSALMRYFYQLEIDR